MEHVKNVRVTISEILTWRRSQQPLCKSSRARITDLSRSINQQASAHSISLSDLANKSSISHTRRPTFCTHTLVDSEHKMPLLDFLFTPLLGRTSGICIIIKYNYKKKITIIVQADYKQRLDFTI